MLLRCHLLDFPPLFHNSCRGRNAEILHYITAHMITIGQPFHSYAFATLEVAETKYLSSLPHWWSFPIL